MGGSESYLFTVAEQLDRLGHGALVFAPEPGEGLKVAAERASIDGAEVVIGYGRAILEAMSCGRAAYVYDWNGGEGWVTEESYPAIEADGIAGRSAARVIDAEQLVADLRRYDPAMGPVNRDLVIAHHRANLHAQELVELFEQLDAVASRPRAPVDEMASLVLSWRVTRPLRRVSGLLGGHRG